MIIIIDEKGEPRDKVGDKGFIKYQSEKKTLRKTWRK